MPGSVAEAVTPEVSVIVTSRERREALLATLRALAVQTVPPGTYEVLVVDDGSSDGTYDAARAIELPCALRVCSGTSASAASRPGATPRSRRPAAAC